MTASRWWECTHADIGLPGCPICDGRLDSVARDALTAARDEIHRLAKRYDVERGVLLYDIDTARDSLLSMMDDLLARRAAHERPSVDEESPRQLRVAVDRMCAAPLRDIAEHARDWLRAYMDGRPLRDWRRW